MTKAHQPSLGERSTIARDLVRTKVCGSPRRVWVEDGHMFVEGHDGTVVYMTPEVAIALGRMISNAGADYLINKVKDDVGLPHPDEPSQG